MLRSTLHYVKKAFPFLLKNTDATPSSYILLFVWHFKLQQNYQKDGESKIESVTGLLKMKLKKSFNMFELRQKFFLTVFVTYLRFGGCTAE